MTKSALPSVLPSARCRLPPAAGLDPMAALLFLRCSTKQIFLVAEFNHLDAEH